MSDRVQFRRDTKARWSEVNPILMEGEIGLEIDTNNVKMGDGVHAWNELEYGVGIENITSELGDSENLAASQKLVKDKLSDLAGISNVYFGKSIYGQSGKIQDSDDTFITDFIPVKANTIYVWNFVKYIYYENKLAFYDKKYKKFLWDYIQIS